MKQFKIGLKSEEIEAFKKLAEIKKMTTSKFIREILRTHLAALDLLDQNSSQKQEIKPNKAKPKWQIDAENRNKDK